MTATSTPHTPVPASGRSTPWRPLVRHYVEMVLAMLVGMFALGALRALLGLAVPFEQRPGAWYVLMAFDMSLGMAAWMRYRGHGWAGTLEMCAAMFVPAVLLPLVWADLMGEMAFMMTAHVVMPVAMLVVLLRRRHEYAHC